MRTVAVVGLGLMGSNLARRLVASGLQVRGFDLDAGRVEEIETFGGIAAGSVPDAVSGAEAVVLSLPDSDVSRVVCLGEGGLAAVGADGLKVYDSTTGRPQDAVEIAEALALRDIDYCDATVSGNAELAQRGDLVVMVGGPLEAYRAGIPIFEAIGRSHHHVGPVGSGSRMKLLVNHALTIHRMALAEVLVVAEKSGLDLGSTLAVLRDGLAYSKAMDLWGERMADADHDPPFSRLRQSNKDARLIVEHAHQVGASADLIEVVAAALDSGEAGGLGDLDNSSVIEVLRRRAGIGRVA